MRTVTLHLLSNAHLDPVWLWDWREGLNEGLITSRTILDLMDEDPELTFMRGEAAIYQHIEQHDPATFERICARVREGRWDVVGGTYIQPDTNLPATETFARHLCHGQTYFIRRFGRAVRAAWAADSFGHSAGLPEILAAAGIRYFAFSRPSHALLPLAKPVFWWVGPGGRRVLAYRITAGWYGNERPDMPARLDQYLEAAGKTDLDNWPVFFGLGNHGGGATRRMLVDIRRWAAAHPGVRVVFSTLHRTFAALESEAAAKGERWLPVHRGELNYCLRGCYVSMARLKFAYRRLEAGLGRAERVGVAVAAVTGTPPPALRPAWEAVLFNSFHDILPGSSIERAYDDQLAWIGGAAHQAQRAELTALNALALRVDCRVKPPRGDHPAPVALLVFNPHPRPYRGPLELEAALDYRPIWAYRDRPDRLPFEVRGPQGQPLGFQRIATEHNSFVNLPWRKRVVLPVELPPLGWSVFTMGWREDARVPAIRGRVRAGRGAIDNGIYRVRAVRGGAGIEIRRRGRPVFAAPGLQAITVEDPWGSWGAMDEQPEALSLAQVRDRWTVSAVDVIEKGPYRACLWVELTGGRSRLELTFSVVAGRDTVDVAARLLWAEKSARLKLVLPGGDRAEFQVPGGTVRRGAVGEVPGGRWVRVTGARGGFGFASDALYGFDLADGALRVSVVRSSLFASDGRTVSGRDSWRPAMDQGEHQFRCLIAPGDKRLPDLADELEQPPLSVPVPPRAGSWPRAGSLLALTPGSLRLLALKPAEDGKGWILRLQEQDGRAADAAIVWCGKRVRLGRMTSRSLATWRLTAVRRGWRATACDIVERPLNVPASK